MIILNFTPKYENKTSIFIDSFSFFTVEEFNQLTLINIYNHKGEYSSYSVKDKKKDIDSQINKQDDSITFINTFNLNNEKISFAINKCFFFYFEEEYKSTIINIKLNSNKHNSGNHTFFLNENKEKLISQVKKNLNKSNF